MKQFGGVAVLAAVTALLAGCANLGTTYSLGSPETANALRAIERHPCTAAVAGALEAHSIPVRDVVFVRTYGESGGGSHTYGYMSFVGLKDQRGHIVVRMDTTCNVRDVFAINETKLPPRKTAN